MASSDNMAPVMLHILFTLPGCNTKLIDDEEFVRQVLFDACAVAEATWLKSCSHRFEPQGVTAVALLAESHLSVHTWPEKGTAVCDIFTCSDSSKAKLAMTFMQDKFEATGLSSKVNVDRSMDEGLHVSD